MDFYAIRSVEVKGDGDCQRGILTALGTAYGSCRDPSKS